MLHARALPMPNGGVKCAAPITTARHIHGMSMFANIAAAAQGPPIAQRVCRPWGCTFQGRNGGFVMSTDMHGGANMGPAAEWFRNAMVFLRRGGLVPCLLLARGLREREGTHAAALFSPTVPHAPGQRPIRARDRGSNNAAPRTSDSLGQIRCKRGRRSAPRPAHGTTANLPAMRSVGRHRQTIPGSRRRRLEGRVCCHRPRT